MYTDSEGIILKQIKIVSGRRIILLFSSKYGKISAGTSINERGKNKSALALRPFTRGRYELFKNKDTYNLNGAETLQSFYSLGEDVDKYMTASYALVLTERLLPEDEPFAAMYSLLCDFLSMLEKRRKSCETLLIGYMIKALTLSGSGMQLNRCVKCGSEGPFSAISVEGGGVICKDCNCVSEGLNPLIFELSDDIINAVQFIENHPLKSLETLALPDESERKLKRVLRSYYSYHLGIENLKSEGLRI